MSFVLTRPFTTRPADREVNPALVLVIILATYLMIILDASIVITALPDIHETLGFSPTGLSWVQNAYTLTFGGLLLLGARAGDILGRRRVFMTGVTVFTIASLLGGLAPSAELLLAARALQGVGAAIAAPAALALLMTTFAEGAERTRALALYSAVASGGGSIGLVLGGMLTTWVSWRLGLFINVPVGIALVALAVRHLPETPRTSGHFDLVGAITSTVGMTALVYGFVRAASDGWGNTGTIASFATGALLLAAFVATERSAPEYWQGYYQGRPDRPAHRPSLQLQRPAPLLLGRRRGRRRPPEPAVEPRPHGYSVAADQPVPALSVRPDTRTATRARRAVPCHRPHSRRIIALCKRVPHTQQQPSRPDHWRCR